MVNKKPDIKIKNRNDIGKPLDPTHDAEEMMGDTTGLTGITVDRNEKDQEGQGFPDNEHVARSMSDAAYKKAIAVAEGKDTDEDTENKKKNTEEEIERVNESTPPDIKGEQSVSGDTPDPGSDDDTLENEHKVGLRQDEDEEHRESLDIASDVDEAEEYHRSH